MRNTDTRFPDFYWYKHSYTKKKQSILIKNNYNAFRRHVVLLFFYILRVNCVILIDKMLSLLFAKCLLVVSDNTMIEACERYVIGRHII